jgi:Tfp pilus assembly protein PilO
VNVKWSWQLGAIAGLGVLGLIVALVGFLVAVQPQRTKLRTVEAQIATAQSQFAALHATAGRKPQIQAAELFQLSRAMPKADDMPGILVGLSQLTSVSHVTLISVTPRPRVALADGSSAVPLAVTIGGTWTQVTSFLRHVRDQVALHGTRLAVAGRVFDVDNVQLTSQSQSPPLLAVLQMNAFDYGAPPSATATAGTQAATTTTTTSSSSQQAAGTQGSGG